MNEPDEQLPAVALDHKLELSHEEIEQLAKERGGAVLSHRHMKLLQRLGIHVETTSAIRIANGEAFFSRSLLRGLMVKMHELCEKPDITLEQLTDAAPAIAAVHKQFTESIRATREIAETQQGASQPRPLITSGPVLSFPTGPINARTVVINEAKPAK